MSSSLKLPPTHRYAAGALFGLALHQAQIHQTSPLGLPPDERSSSGSSTDSVSDDPQLWVHESSDLLRPIFKFLDIDDKAWSGLEETTASTPPKHHVGAFLRLLSEESDDGSSEAAEMELALANGIDAMASSMERSSDNESMKEKRREYKHECAEKLSIPDLKPKSDVESTNVENYEEKSQKASSIVGAHLKSVGGSDEKPVEEVSMLGYTRKVTILYELLSACLAQVPEDGKKTTRRRKGYDARHRVALRLLATWLNVRWIKVEAIETMVACSAMALLKEEESKGESQSPDSSWAKWKRGGIIGAAALTGGTLMAITGGLAAPAIAAGFGALAPTLGPRKTQKT